MPNPPRLNDAPSKTRSRSNGLWIGVASMGVLGLLVMQWASAQPVMRPPASDSDQCATASCHVGQYQDKLFVHGPVAVGGCIACHEPHTEFGPSKLRRSPPGLCLDCHAEMKPHGPATGLNFHSPFKDGCLDCHDPHASDHEFHLVMVQRELCFSCHDGFHDTIENADIIHSPASATGDCTACHSPHFSTLPNLQLQAQPALCLSCHNEEIELPSGDTIVNMAALLEENPIHHGPIKDGSCTACHQPHAANKFRLLHQEYPSEFYAPFDIERYQLCFTCHDADLVKDESGRGLTGFRDGDRNLHWLHVNREKGRTCRACHEVHASKQPFHISESVPFGTSGWKLPIRFEQTEDGGSCAPGCHKPRTYNRTLQAATGDKPHAP